MRGLWMDKNGTDKQQQQQQQQQRQQFNEKIIEKAKTITSLHCLETTFFFLLFLIINHWIYVCLIKHFKISMF